MGFDEAGRHDTRPGDSGSRFTTASRPRMLRTYLNDHLAGAGACVDLARRLARAHRSTPAGAALHRLAEEIARDHAALVQIMTDLDVPTRRYKTVLARLAEKVGRLKPNNRLLRRSPMSSVVELEMMWLGVQGKSRLWRTLRTLADRDDRLDADWLDHLLDRARQQAGDLEDVRERAVADVLGTTVASR